MEVIKCNKWFASKFVKLLNSLEFKILFVGWFIKGEVLILTTHRMIHISIGKEILPSRWILEILTASWNLIHSLTAIGESVLKDLLELLVLSDKEVVWDFKKQPSLNEHVSWETWHSFWCYDQFHPLDVGWIILVEIYFLDIFVKNHKSVESSV